MIKYLQTCGLLVLVAISVRSQTLHMRESAVVQHPQKEKVHNPSLPHGRSHHSGHAKVHLSSSDDANQQYLRQQVARTNFGYPVPKVFLSKAAARANSHHHVAKLNISHVRRRYPPLRYHHSLGYQFKHKSTPGQKDILSDSKFLKSFRTHKESKVKDSLSRRDYLRMGLKPRNRKASYRKFHKAVNSDIASTPLMTKKPATIAFPEIHSKDQVSNLRVPSSTFCTKMNMKSADQYFLLPWWYYFCQNLHERKEKKFSHNIFYLPLYLRVINQVRQVKKKLMMDAELDRSKDTFNYNQNGLRTV